MLIEISAMNDKLDHLNNLRDPVSIGGAVEQLQIEFPEINASTLRFLESEGMLSPERTSGGHRLYHEEDLERIRFVRKMQSEGLPIARIRERLMRLDRLGDSEELSAIFFERVTNGDRAGAAQLIRDADSFGMPLTTIFVDIIGEAMRKVGNEWERGNILVGQEKEATELVKDLVAELSVHRATPSLRGAIVLAAGVKGELHDLGLRMVSGLLREQGYQVHLLGADVAASFLIEAVKLRCPDIVLLGATLSERLPALVQTIRELQTASSGEGKPQIIVGGPLSVDYADELMPLGVILPGDSGVRAAVNAVIEYSK
jgi:methanogenic corrinoid protein MtbC1